MKLTWAVIGLKQGNQYRVIASSDFEHVRLEAKTTFNRSYPFFGQTDPKYTVLLEINDLASEVGDSYEEALEKLFRHWSPPDDQDEKTLPPGQE